MNIHRFPNVLVYNGQPFSVSLGEVNNQFFDVFTFEFLRGSTQTAFEGERPIIISEDFAKKIFGNTAGNMIGEPIYDRYSLRDGAQIGGNPFIITAVVRIPQNTHIQFDVLVEAEKTSQHGSSALSWKGNYYTTFVRMASNATFTDTIRTQMASYLTKHLPNDKRMLAFQPLTDIHLKPGVEDSNLSGDFGEPRYIFIFLTMTLFVLAIAIINYVNLTIARAANRTREVGIRKAGGAFTRELVLQFLIESLAWALVATLLAFLLSILIMPWFSGIVGATLKVDYSLRTLFTALGLSLFVGFLAGSYSALYQSSFRPSISLKGGSLTGSKSVLRKTLLALQLAISVFILLCTVVVFRQLHFIQNKDIGFDRDHVIGINTGLWYGIRDFKQEVLKNANVEAVSIASCSPVDISWNAELNWDGKTTETDDGCSIILCDWDYAKVFRLQMTQGSFLPENLGWWQYTDEMSKSKVLNETAAKIVGIKDIVGTKVNDGKVVGIVKDFNFKSFHHRISPLVMEHNPEGVGKVFIRLNPHNQKATLDYIKNIFHTFKKDNPFEYYWMADEYKALYRKEFRLGSVFFYFSLLSIFISCMGVFSLVALLVKFRSKEIAIRKINGAGAFDIMYLFAREFLSLTIFAFVVASPFAWFAMYHWLQNYQYHIGISWWIFAGVLMLTLMLTLLSLIVQVLKAASRHPVESLKYE